MWTNDYIRIPFKERGRERSGADCWGLARIIFSEQLGIDLPALVGYADTKDRAHISEIIKTEAITWEFLKSGSEKAFDIAVFKMLGQPMHVGVVVEPGLMIHCERGSGVYLTHYNKENQWYRRLEGFFRYAKCANITAAFPSSQENAASC